MRAQTGLSERSTITVIDDESQDGTATAIARHSAIDPRVRIVSAGVLPEGWTGKSHACWRGALLAGCEWLCFIDADVRAAPQLVSVAVAAAEACGVDMLSLQPFQELGSFWERTIMPAGMLVLACAKSFRQDAEDVVNGQFLLIRRAVYFRIGGHSAVRGQVAEDRALAERIVKGDFKLQVLARKAAATLAFGWISSLLPLAVILYALRNPSPLTLSGAGFALCGSAVVFAIQSATARRLEIPIGFGLNFTLGYTAVACLACNGVAATLTGRVRWKGRVYPVAKSTVQSQ